MSDEYIAVDFDGTLAYYDYWRGIEHLGDPIMPMVERIKKWLFEGRKVLIFTARVAHDGSEEGIAKSQRATVLIMDYCKQHIGVALPVTCQKDPSITEIWDDRAIRVKKNEGIPEGIPTFANW